MINLQEKCQSPPSPALFFRRLAPAPYFHPLFIFQIPPSWEDNENLQFFYEKSYKRAPLI